MSPEVLFFQNVVSSRNVVSGQLRTRTVSQIGGELYRAAAAPLSASRYSEEPIYWGAVHRLPPAKDHKNVYGFVDPEDRRLLPPSERDDPAAGTPFTDGPRR